MKLSVNDTIGIIDKSDEYWWYGRKNDTVAGYFPFFYVKDTGKTAKLTKTEQSIKRERRKTISLQQKEEEIKRKEEDRARKEAEKEAERKRKEEEKAAKRKTTTISTPVVVSEPKPVDNIPRPTRPPPPPPKRVPTEHVPQASSSRLPAPLPPAGLPYIPPLPGT